MAERYLMALSATETSDLVELARILSAATQEVIQENAFPHMDPAVQMIAYHIAYAANGDSAFAERYELTYKFLRHKVLTGQNYVIIGQQDEQPQPPVLQAS